MNPNLRRRCKEDTLAERVLIKIVQRLDALLIGSIKFQLKELKEMKNTTNKYRPLDADELRKAVEQILSTSQEHYTKLWKELESKRPSYYADQGGTPHYLEIHGKVYYFETGKKCYIGYPPNYEKIPISPTKSTTAIKTIDQLLGFPTTKAHVKINPKDVCLGKGSRNIHKQHKHNSR